MNFQYRWWHIAVVHNNISTACSWHPTTRRVADVAVGYEEDAVVVLSWQLCVCCHGTSLSVCLSSWPRCCHDKTLKLLPWEHTDAVSVAVSRRLLRRVVMRRKMKLNKTTRKMTLLPQFLVEDIAMRCLPTALEWVSRHSLFCIVYFRGGSAADLQDLFRRIEWIKEGWDPVSVESMLWVPFTATTLLSQWQKTNSDQLNKQ